MSEVTKLEPPGTIPCRHNRAIVLEDRPLVMGVLNLTPDSFSDGSLWLEPGPAIARAHQMLEEGAELLDLGAESTRPGGGVYGSGASPVTAEEELRRLLPVLEALRPEVAIPISVDTRKGRVAKEALAAGADLINDVSALGDPDLAQAVSEAACPIVLMHSRGELRRMQEHIQFQDLVREVKSELEAAIERAIDAGIDRQKILIDPGIGFGKSAQQNLILLRQLDAFDNLGCPVLVGASRKSFIGQVVGAPVDRRLAGSLASVGWAALRGAAIVRVHDVAETVQFLKLWKAIAQAGEETG